MTKEEEFLEKQGYCETVTPPNQEPFSPSFKRATVVRLLDEYATQLKEEIERLREFVKMVAGFHPDDNPIKLIQAAEALSTKQKGETND